MEVNLERIEKAAAQDVADHLLNSESLRRRVDEAVQERINKHFEDTADERISKAVEDAIQNGFEREYQRVDHYGQRDGEPTTIRKELEKLVSAYWSEKVDPRSGKPSTSYGAISRADYIMTTICAEDFSATLQQSARDVTGALKDGLRVQLAAQMDRMLNDLFRIKSLQDQGKVEKPY